MTQAPSAAHSLEEAAAFIRSKQRVAILSHVNPDADAIGSVLGLTLGIRDLGKRADSVLADRIPDYARFLKGAESIRAELPDDLDALILVDAAGIDRVGSLYFDHAERFSSLPILNVDHHRTNPLFGTVNYVDPHASSTSELVYRLLAAVEVSPPVEAAEALLFGIVGDTGSFRNGATTPGSLETAAHLVELGGDVQRIAFQLFECKTFAAARLWGLIVSTIELDARRQIVLAWMSQEMLRTTGATADEAEGVAEYLRGISEAEVVMLMKETPEGEIRVSMRSRPAVDVSAIAKALGGGGHRQAAGCTLPGPVSAARDMLITTYDALNPPGA